jgi:hypothetical protein
MKLPCEIGVLYVIPTIRSELAKELLKLGMNQKNISILLNVSQAAISQYKNDKRGYGIKFNKEIQGLIKEFAKDLYESRATEKDIVPRTCQICKMVNLKDILIQLNKEKDNIPFDCQECLSNK